MPQSNNASQTVPPCLRFLVAPEASRLPRARERVRDYLTLVCCDQAPVDDVVLAVEEACTNAIRHSGSRREIEIRLSFEGDDLLAAVKDHGSGFDVDAFDTQTLPDPLVDTGRGLFLISRLCDEMELRRNGGLEVCLVKRGVARYEPAALESGLGDISGTLQKARREARTRTLLEEIDEAFMIFDWEYRFVHVNEATMRLVGKTRDELIGRRSGDIWPASGGTPAALAVREAMELGKSSVIEFRAVGSGDWLEARIYPTPAGVSLYARGIDQRGSASSE
jgi:PAS domain S-box-containing protein